MVTIRPKYACSKGRAGVAQARAPAHLLEGSWPTEAMLAHIAVAKHSEHMPLNRQVRVMARHGFPVERSVLADWMGRVGAHVAPVVDRMAVLLKSGTSRLYGPSCLMNRVAPVRDWGCCPTRHLCRAVVGVGPVPSWSWRSVAEYGRLRLFQ